MAVMPSNGRPALIDMHIGDGDAKIAVSAAMLVKTGVAASDSQVATTDDGALPELRAAR